ncbi:MAG TPA: PLP-dependent lyase/thiolase [Candidatus Paceibacterota bacterium]
MITPQEEYPKLAKALGLSAPLYFKREDLHPLGSHKGRSIPYMIEQHAKGGHRHFAISSSGNAALAAIMYIREYNEKFPEQPLDLQIFVGEHVNTTKHEILRHEARDNPKIQIIKCEKPKQAVHILNKKGEAKSLRQSIDPLALIGYQSLVNELSELGEVNAIFVPTSSGTVAEALASHFPVHIVQTTKCHPIAEWLDAGRLTIEGDSLADAIVDIVAPRKESLSKLIRNGWIITNREIKNAIETTKDKTGLELSPNSALAVAGLIRALNRGWKPDNTIVCLITGR